MIKFLPSFLTYSVSLLKVLRALLMELRIPLQLDPRVLQTVVFWLVTPCSLVDKYQRFGEYAACIFRIVSCSRVGKQRVSEEQTVSILRVASCNLVDGYRRVRENCCLHLHGLVVWSCRWIQTFRRSILASFTGSIDHTLKTETACSYEYPKTLISVLILRILHVP
jgi:hypothetical protein